MEKKHIDRINELAKKHKEVGLTEEENLERQKLREAYLEDFRANFRARLENIDIVSPEEYEEYKKNKKN
ncbi:MAG: DUF896 domain-containing protein [Clostridioides sp.]|jgi:uncharacterized protein YnzC (UPF0291/DUF896 family)|nr:DUF896 domain-containing protein [Clostridioides sp.]